MTEHRLQPIFALALLLMLAGGIWAVQPATAAPPKQAPPLPATLSAVNGQSIFAENCTPCHGTGGKGDGPTAASLPAPPPNFTDPATLNAMSPSEIFTTIKEGRMDKMMPPWKQRLSDDQIWDAAAYLLTLNASEAVIETGKTTFNDSCATCHSVGGSAADVDFSNAATLANSSADAIVASFRAPDNVHAEPLQSLADADIIPAVAFVRTLSMELPAPVPHDGVLTGTVHNGTTGASMPDITLKLYTVTSDGNLLETADGASGSDGTFAFENLRREHTVNFVLEAVYDDVHYFSKDPAVFLPDSTETSLDVNVYETTDDPGTVKPTTLHRIVAFVPDFISITDIYVYANDSDKTFVGTMGADGLPETIKITLPDNAQEISFQFSTARQSNGNIYVDSRPVPPGKDNYSLAVSYAIPIDGKSATLKTPLLDTIPQVNLLVVDQGEAVSSDQLKRLDDRPIQGDTYQQWTGANLPGGQDFVMTFDRLNKLDFSAPPPDSSPVASGWAASGPNQQYLQWGVLGLGVLLIIFVLFMVNRSEPVAVIATSAAEKTHLVALLQELDAMRATGVVDDAMYQRLRTRYRDQLKEILAPK